MSDIEKLRALLAEAREFVALFHEAGCPENECEGCAAANDMNQRIDAALAEPVRDDFKRGAEAMREAAARLVDDTLSHTLTDAADRIRALPIPEDKR